MRVNRVASVLIAGKPALHPLGPFGENLECVLWRERHDGEHPVQELVGHSLVEQVRSSN